MSGPIDLDITVRLDAGTVTIQGRDLTDESVQEVVAIIGRARLAGALDASAAKPPQLALLRRVPLPGGSDRLENVVIDHGGDLVLHIDQATVEADGTDWTLAAGTYVVKAMPG